MSRTSARRTGSIAVTLYPDDRSRFLARRGSLYVGRVPARAGTTRVCIHLPGTGIWALGVYHDEDGNRRFTRSGLGLPRGRLWLFEQCAGHDRAAVLPPGAAVGAAQQHDDRDQAALPVEALGQGECLRIVDVEPAQRR